MKRILILISLFVATFLLVSCAAGRYPYPTSELGKETWRQQVQTNSDYWASDADQWFQAGGNTEDSIANERAPYTEAITHTSVRVPNFRSIKVTGDFQVKIFNEEDHNGVWIEGPNKAVRHLGITVRRHVLCIDQDKDAPTAMRRVVVHIGVKQLRSLVYKGDGRLEGIRILSDHLSVETAGCGNVFLAGHINLKSVISRGTGSVNIFTMHADDTKIETFGAGSVNVDAKQGVVLRSVIHHGTGDINIIGAASRGLVVHADGKGKVGISGQVTIKEISASGSTCVFIPNSAGGVPCVYVYDDARVGLAGGTGTLYAYTTRTSRFLGRNLLAHTAYVNASGISHMNINATHKVFATARDYATIYFFGKPSRLSAIERNNGSVIAMNAVPDTMQPKPKKKRHIDYKAEAGGPR